MEEEAEAQTHAVLTLACVLSTKVGGGRVYWALPFWSSQLSRLSANSPRAYTVLGDALVTVTVPGPVSSELQIQRQKRGPLPDSDSSERSELE